ncbi:hypothetical protein CC80DRAFT_149335 [Byssothecium circinans]|uniref:Uncharacterized protein n=1 Tax=Byssothecium circinans TaxID=147558 RepID=A0A6A5TM18_9PLEO|nr:hypothetical protein CC80DRAFT_149335 [Byssothecium circinans]
MWGHSSRGQICFPKYMRLEVYPNTMQPKFKRLCIYTNHAHVMDRGSGLGLELTVIPFLLSYLVLSFLWEARIGLHVIGIDHRNQGLETCWIHSTLEYAQPRGFYRCNVQLTSIHNLTFYAYFTIYNYNHDHDHDHDHSTIYVS